MILYLFNKHIRLLSFIRIIQIWIQIWLSGLWYDSALGAGGPGFDSWLSPLYLYRSIFITIKMIKHSYGLQ